MKQVEQVRKEIEELNKEIKNRCFYIDWFNRNHQQASDMIEELKKSFEKYGFKDAVWKEDQGNNYNNNFNYSDPQSAIFGIVIYAKHRTYKNNGGYESFYRKMLDKIGLKVDLVKASFPKKIISIGFNPWTFDSCSSEIKEKEVCLIININVSRTERSLS